MQVSFEDGVTSDVTDYLTSCGHMLNDTVFLASNVVQGIAVKDGRVYANYDFRKTGGVAGFWGQYWSSVKTLSSLYNNLNMN